MSLRCAQKLARLSAIVAERVAWEKQLAQVKRMRQWVLDAEHLSTKTLASCHGQQGSGSFDHIHPF